MSMKSAEETVRKSGAEDRERIAQQLEQLLPRLMRSISTLTPEDPLYSVTTSQMKVLTLVSTGTTSTTCLGNQLKISLSAVSQIIERLRESGLIESVEDTEDRRQRVIRLTKIGQSAMDARKQGRIHRINAALNEFSEGESSELLHWIQKLAETCQAPTDPATREDFPYLNSSETP